MKESITSAVIGALVLGAMFWGGLFILTPHSSQPVGGSLDIPAYSVIGVSGTSTTKAVTSSSGPITATSTGISYLVISNGGAPIWCQADSGKAAAVNSGIGIASSSQYVFSLNGQNMYRGIINCITAAGTSNIAVYSH